MAMLVRLLVLLGALMIGGMIVLWHGGPGFSYLIAPKTLLVVLGLTCLLGVMTYQPRILLKELKKAFDKADSSKEEIRKPVLIQLAIYALISGILLALVQILINIGEPGTISAGQVLSSLRTTLTSLLYAVLIGMALLVVAGRDAKTSTSPEEEKETGKTAGRQALFGACLLLVTVGLLSVLLSGMVLDEKRERASENSVEVMTKTKAPENTQDVKQVQGLILGEDMIWRPARRQGPPKSAAQNKSSESNIQAVKPESVFLALDMMENPEEVPLRWELSIDSNRVHPQQYNP